MLIVTFYRKMTRSVHGKVTSSTLKSILWIIKMFCFKFVFPGWLFLSSLKSAILDLQKYIKILSFYSIEPSYKTVKCFEDTVLSNKKFEKSCKKLRMKAQLSRRYTRLNNHHLNPYFQKNFHQNTSLCMH